MGKTLCASKVAHVLGLMNVDPHTFWAHYTAVTRGFTPSRIAAVVAYNQNRDRVQLMKRLGTKSAATAFKVVGQVTDYLERFESAAGSETMTGYIERLKREEQMELPTAEPASALVTAKEAAAE